MNSSQYVNTNIKDYKFTENSFLPKFVSIPISQEFDRTFKVIVKPGDKVEEGQIIATSEDGTNIHSSVPGTVSEIIPCICPNGKQEYTIKIYFGGSFSYLGKLLPQKDYKTMSSSQIISDLISNGVINTFDVTRPENLGLEIKSKNKNSILIVRLFDEDIYRITDSLITKFYFDKVITGAEITAKAINAEAILFVIDQRNDLSEKIANLKIPNSYTLKMSLKKYSTAFKRGIILSFNKSMRKTCNFSISRNDLFVDASSMYEVYKTIIYGIPSISKDIQISGNCINSSCLLNVRIGTRISEIVSQIGGISKNPSQILINGMLNGVFVNDINVPVTKYVKSITFLAKERTTDKQIYSCVNCGYCRVACPVNISPDILYNNATKFLKIPVEHAVSAVTCIECGICNTVCPSRLPLSQTISILKNSQRNIMDKENDVK